MSGDELIFELENREKAAKEICVQAKVLARCEECHDVFNDWSTDGATEAYKLGNWLMTQTSPLVAVFNQDRTIMTDTIKAVFEDAPDQCTCVDDHDRAMAKDD